MKHWLVPSDVISYAIQEKSLKIGIEDIGCAGIKSDKGENYQCVAQNTTINMLQSGIDDRSCDIQEQIYT